MTLGEAVILGAGGLFVGGVLVVVVFDALRYAIGRRK